MSVIGLIRARVIVGLLFAAVLAAAVAIAEQPAFSNHALPLFIPGNPNCSDLAPAGVIWYQFTIQPVESGSYRYADQSLTLEVYDTFTGEQFDWQSNSGVNAVFVKGGPGGNLYQYAPPGGQETSDGGLHAPLNLLRAEFYGMSHLLFCTSKQPPTPTPPIKPTPLPTATGMPGPTPTPTRLPGGRLFFLPLDTFNSMSGEENDSCDEDFPIKAHMTHQFMADDTHDWYEFDLAGAGKLVVELTNFLPQDGQIAVFKGEDCDVATIVCNDTVCNNGESSATKTLDLGPQEAGRYYLYVSNDGVPNTTDLYQLFAGFR